MNTQDFLTKTFKIDDLGVGWEHQAIRERIVCKDGVTLSVQASETHYCFPRVNRATYSEVEVGYPSIRPPAEWGQYFDGTWMDLSVAGYVAHFLSNAKRFMWTWKNIGFRSAKRHLNFRDNATDSVYGYVPIELVDSFIEEHGGIDEAETFKA